MTFEEWLAADVDKVFGTHNVDLPHDMAVDYVRRVWDAAVAAERERCAMKLQVTRADVSLAAGELSAQEWRTCSAVLSWMQYLIRCQ